MANRTRKPKVTGQEVCTSEMARPVCQDTVARATVLQVPFKVPSMASRTRKPKVTGREVCTSEMARPVCQDTVARASALQVHFKVPNTDDQNKNTLISNGARSLHYTLPSEWARPVSRDSGESISSSGPLQSPKH